MTLLDAASLFVVMSMLALVPGASVMLVIGRTLEAGVASGMMAVAGIVVGDLCFVALALLGLSAVVQLAGEFFGWIRMAAAFYLIWLGVALFTAKPAATAANRGAYVYSRLAGSFLSGLLLTLADLKAVFFYISLFPVFIDVSMLQATDTALILLLTILSVAGAKCLYVLAASRLSSASVASRYQRMSGRLAGGLLIGAGVYLLLAYSV